MRDLKLHIDMQLSEQLKDYLPFNHEEAAMLAQFRDFLRDSERSQGFGREVVGGASIGGHITATAWVVDAAQTQTLLTYHAKAGEWVPPAEHCDDDADIAAVARRIAQQSTGLQVVPLISGIFGINVRLVPEYWNTPEHRHYEVCFAFQGDAAAPMASPKVRWVALDEVAQLNSAGWLARLVEKTRRLAV